MATAKIIQNNTFQLTAGAAITGRDAIEIGPEGKAYPVVTTDYAAVTNCTYGTAQTSTATGRIFAQTQIDADYVSAANADEQRICVGDNGDIYAVAPYTTTNGLELIRYSSAGRWLGSASVITANAATYNPCVIKLSNGNIAVTSQSGTGHIYYAVYSPALVEVKAPTQIEAVYSPASSQHGVVALAAGGFAMVYQPNTGSGLYTHLAVYDNNGTAVVAPTNIWTRSGSAGYPQYRIAQLSNGNIVILAHMLGITGGTYNGQWHAIYTTAGVLVSAFTQIYAQDAYYTSFLKVSGGYYAVSSAGKGGGTTYDIYVFNNAGSQQGSAYSRSDGSAYGNPMHLASGTDCFWFISYRIGSPSGPVLAKIPYTGGASATLTYMGSIGGNTSRQVIFVENGYIIALNKATSLYAVYVISEATGSLISSSVTDIGTGGVAADTLCVTPGGDRSFIAYYDFSATAGTYIVAGKYANTSVVGVAAASAAQGDPVNIKQAAGTYICNTLKGTAAVAFDHTTGATVAGNKGTLLTGGVVLRGM